MLIKFGKLKYLIQEDISRKTNSFAVNLFNKNGKNAVITFWKVYSFLEGYKKLPNDEDYGDFANENALLWKADGELEFLVNLLMSHLVKIPTSSDKLLGDPKNETTRQIFEASALLWLYDNGFSVKNRQISKGKK